MKRKEIAKLREMLVHYFVFYWRDHRTSPCQVIRIKSGIAHMQGGGALQLYECEFDHFFYSKPIPRPQP